MRRALMLLMLAFAFPALAQEQGGGITAIRGATIFTAPDEKPVTDGVILIRGGKIQRVGGRGLRIPRGATVLDYRGKFVTAGFQNSHVHLIEPKWNGAASLPVARLEAQLEAMLTRYGITTAIEAAAIDVTNTVALRRRIESGEVRGPRILTTGAALFPSDGIPFYVREILPPAELAMMKAPATPEEARREVAANFDAGADYLKLFTVSWAARGRTKPMDAAIAAAAVEEAHRRGKLVLVHPTNTLGFEIALAAGADILAHAVEDRAGWTPEHSQSMARSMAMAPTLALMQGGPAVDGVREFHRLGGRVLFGTDVGFVPDYDPAPEYALMAAAGMTPMDILASLTTVPARAFGEGDRRGRIRQGQDADLVVLDADPRSAATAFSSVRATIRGGRVIYTR